MTSREIATIGYQGATVAELVQVLATAGVRHVIDVRAVPLSRKPGFSKRQLAAELAGVGLLYSGLRGLGTPRAGRDAARRGDVATMHAIFAQQMASDEAQRDLGLAKVIAAEAPACLICFERDPHGCHRLLVAQAMGGPIRHLFCDVPDPAAPALRRRRASGVSAAPEPP